MIDRSTVTRLAARSRDAAARCSAADLRSALEQVAGRLDEPLKVAVAGRMKAGKSTVVNALLGREIAPTAATECTKVVAEYIYAADEGVRVHLIDGDAYSVAPTLVGGPPDDLGRDADDIDHITVRMSSSRRRDWTLVDTPGLDSTTAGVSDTTERTVLGDPASARAVSKVDGLLYLMPHPGETDVSFLTQFAAVFDGTRLGGINIAGVLSKIDLLGGAERNDPLEEGRRLARRKADELAGVVDTVVPVSGLLGQAAFAGGYREQHTTLIRTLASVEPARLRRSVRLLDRFVADENLGLDARERWDLVSILGMWGISHVVAAYRDGLTSTPAIVDGLRRLSNLDELSDVVNRRLAPGASLVRMSACLAELDGLAYQAMAVGEAEVGTDLHAVVAEVRSRPDFHRIVEVQALRTFDPTRSRLDDDLRRDVVAVLRGVDVRERLEVSPEAPVEQVREAAQSRAQVWRGVENGGRTRRSDQAVAAVLRRSYELVAADGWLG
jgi:hypothetical protein